MVTLKTVDRLVGLILLGSYSWWRATRRVLGRRGMMGTMPGMDPIWYLLGTLVAVSVIFVVYVTSREHLSEILSGSTSDGEMVDKDQVDESHGSPRNPPSPVSGRGEPPMAETQVSKQPSPLTFLPEDEQRVLEPVLESPGLTQVELRGRSDFSKAKVSQTVSELEDRGLIYREKQGRTYRVYPGELLKDQDGS